MQTGPERVSKRGKPHFALVFIKHLVVFFPFMYYILHCLSLTTQFPITEVPPATFTAWCSFFIWSSSKITTTREKEVSIRQLVMHNFKEVIGWSKYTGIQWIAHYLLKTLESFWNLSFHFLCSLHVKEKTPKKFFFFFFLQEGTMAFYSNFTLVDKWECSR